MTQSIDTNTTGSASDRSEPAEGLGISPADEHNKELLSHVHPPDWVNPTPADRYDMVVIGAGTAGLVTAAASAGLGRRVALVERHLMGGDCLNVGCVPSKAVLRSGRVLAEVRDAERFGIRGDGYAADFGAVMERMRRIRSEIAPHDGATRFRDLGIDVFLGSGQFTGPQTVAVNGQELRFKKACIATGGRAVAPPIPGLEEVGHLTNETVFSLTELPPRLAVIGAGPIGCELAQAFARLGSEVRLIDTMHGVLPREDPECAEVVRQSLLRDGIDIRCCARSMQFERSDGGKRLSLESHGEPDSLEVDEVLVAAGRAANVEGLGLEAAGVAYEAKQGVTVDDRLRTSNPHIFGAGDVCFPYKFTHAADANARIVVRNALLGWLPFKPRASALTIPWCTYTEPELAHVGAHPRELDEAGVRYDTVRVTMDGVDRSVLEGHAEGLLKVHVKRGSGQILGASLVARHAGELISEITTAMVHGIKLHKLSSVIHPYPTEAEVIKRAADQYMRRRLIALKDRVMKPVQRLRGRPRSAEASS